MGGIDGVSGSQAASWDSHDRDFIESSRTPKGATAEWANDRAVPDAVRNYDPSMFSNPALRSGAAAPPVAAPLPAPAAAPLAPATAPAVTPAPDPLPVAADAYRGIHLACLSDDRPHADRSMPKYGVRAGAYTLEPSVRVHEDGSASLVYWTAVNREMKRAELVVGPESLETFTENVSSFENAGATAYMNGEPNEWQRKSMKAVDDAMAKGPIAAAKTLASAWAAAVRDPSWWGQNVLAASTSLAAHGATARSASAAASEESAAARAPAAPGRSTPLVEGGGLGAHEGGTARGHLLDRHVGKTPAELDARFARSRGISASSSFYDRAQAEAGASKALAANDADVAEWLRSGQNRTLPIEYHPNGPSFPVGVSVARAGAEATPVAGVRLVLVKDAAMPAGFRILTGYPIP